MIVEAVSPGAVHSEPLRTEDATRRVLFDGGSGEVLVWVPALICVALMIVAMALFGSAGTSGAPTSTLGTSAPGAFGPR